MISTQDFDYQALSDEWHRSRRHAATLEKFVAKTEINWLTPRRKGKKLLVLDLDHTLLDFNRHDPPTQVSANSKRPGMDAFLEAVYEDYDLVVWSQTHWRWLELKLTALGMLSSAKYKICFVLDKTSMFRIVSRRKDGSEFKHAVKPLRLIWDKVEGCVESTCELGYRADGVGRLKVDFHTGRRLERGEHLASRRFVEEFRVKSPVGRQVQGLPPRQAERGAGRGAARVGGVSSARGPRVEGPVGVRPREMARRLEADPGGWLMLL